MLPENDVAWRVVSDDDKVSSPWTLIIPQWIPVAGPTRCRSGHQYGPSGTDVCGWPGLIFVRVPV